MLILQLTGQLALLSVLMIIIGWECFIVSGTVWLCLGMFLCVWECFVVSGNVSLCLGMFHCIWECFFVFRNVLLCLGMFRCIWECFIFSTLHRQTLLLLTVFVCLFVFFIIPFSHQSLHSLLLPENSRDQIETLTQCAQWSQSEVVSVTCVTGVVDHQTFLTMVPICYSSELFIALSLHAWCCDITAKTFAAMRAMIMCSLFGAGFPASSTQNLEFLYRRYSGILWQIFCVLWLVSVPYVIPVISVAVPKLWLFLAGDVLAQYPLSVFTCVIVPLTLSSRFSRHNWHIAVLLWYCAAVTYLESGFPRLLESPGKPWIFL